MAMNTLGPATVRYAGGAAGTRVARKLYEEVFQDAGRQIQQSIEAGADILETKAQNVVTEFTSGAPAVIRSTEAWARRAMDWMRHNLVPMAVNTAGDIVGATAAENLLFGPARPSLKQSARTLRWAIQGPSAAALTEGLVKAYEAGSRNTAVRQIVNQAVARLFGKDLLRLAKF